LFTKWLATFIMVNSSNFTQNLMKYIVKIECTFDVVLTLSQIINSFVVMELSDISNFQNFQVIIIISIVFWNYTTRIWLSFNLCTANIWHYMINTWHVYGCWYQGLNLGIFWDNCFCNQLPFNIMIKCVKDYIYHDYT